MEVAKSPKDGLLDYDEGLISFGEIENINKLSFRQKNSYMSKFGILFQNVALFKGMSTLNNIMAGRNLKMKRNKFFA